MTRLTCLLLLLLLLLSGCVGFVKSNPKYIEVKTEFKTKDQVRAALGDPRRITQEGEMEVWHYLLTKPISKDVDEPLAHGGFMASLIVIPIWWTTKLDENVRVTFQGENVSGVSQLKDKGGGFMCNAVGMHPYGDAGCHGISEE